MAAAALAGAGLAAAALPPVEVSQRGRAFQPGEVQIDRGQVVRFVNDDGELLHHVYSRSAAFSFDLGEHEPGSRSDVRFTAAGTFAVLCNIHPRMRLTVVVR